ncbi:hypothetical protein BSF42_35450 [Flavobacterium sp. ACN6]|nr:hypothetical protein BSF42_35450 [Flavobacterium sp. ACN6]
MINALKFKILHTNLTNFNFTYSIFFITNTKKVHHKMDFSKQQIDKNYTVGIFNFQPG